ncbi:hypothetical protein [Skermanella stibiiresistens]|nr:hypothetical protein [Skermanella stibiiresistens]
MSTFPVLYFLICVVTGLFALGRRGGFLLYFAVALFVTPIIALVFLIVTSRRPKPQPVEA